MAPIKSYEFVTTNLKRTKAELRSSDGTPIYELDLSFATTDCIRTIKPGRHAIVLQSAASGNDIPSTLGTCDFTFRSMTTPIHLGFGDAEAKPDDVIWEDIHMREKMRQSGFELTVDLGAAIGRKTFDWKRTHDVENKSAISQKLDTLHLKMVERETGAVVARFVHSFAFGSKRGVFEFEEFEGGEDWERVVVLSGVAVLEYLRKSQGWSW
ncbi:hypothetical protein AUEXF2481DRAFT_7569 [Aureobasidium subglaciale EXF-2481]|uniref:Uncharacterized protein n=1 Tax=Aureobasidium subglaciale (strain EXF-2481) TaxID=1043005 RepID=A0A074Y3W3_AURSE|nr:uncharacterized protein AUEXF2481DRAFT_7569 [Aureobasidium subglaciale EXF-2481]KAI5210849.1 hypothetical protein E4T38_01795 [Aureobasidium subglaciale]KAI5229390.1 hypothetical protein E4T40_01685 [Aureobasidium subglaciale]KAI5232944.1 hypothetical protein E4T41_01793 [Aureobasidium subglaciale]KAI5266393.1 hypothetical protein E4T46_01682 [Aureobasidium subglaciale]KEQ92483.1 hypothetical protein AUEXF2481DRAFT_7569 [Aureobasidium subglaciale EXF-2481]